MSEITEKSKSRRIISDAAKFTSAGYFSNVFNMITGIVIRKVLGPTFMGLFSELMLLTQYAKNNHFGILNALDREIPIFRGRNDYSKVKKMGDIGLSFCLLSSSLISLIIIMVSFLIRQYYDSRLFMGIIIIGVLVIAQSVVSFLTVFIRTHHGFTLLSKYTLLFTILDMALKIFLVIRYGLYGLLWAFVLTAATGIIYLLHSSGYRFHFQIKLPLSELGRLIKIGFPILFSGIVFITLCSMDRFFIIRFLGKTQLGYYSIATMMHEFIFLLPNLICTVLFPRFYEKYGEKNNIQDLREDYLKPTLVFAYFFPIIIGLVILILPLLLHYVLPKFWPGFKPAVILIFGTFFLSILNMSGYLLTALNKQHRVALIATGSIIISAALNYVFVKILGLGLRGVAFAMLFTYFIYATVLITYAFSHYTRKIIELLKFLLKLYAPLIWIAGALFIITSFFVYNFSSISQDIAIASIRVITFLLASIPLILYVHNRTKILTTLLEVIQARFTFNRNS